MELHLLLILSKLGAVLSLPNSKNACDPPYADVGGHCLLVENLNSGSWDEMRSFCELLGGTILKLDDLELMYSLVNYIGDHGMAQTNFWIGGTDAGHEGDWKWTDSTAVRMGTPFWANYGNENTQSPEGGAEQNCLEIVSDFHYYFNDRECSKENYVICQQ